MSSSQVHKSQQPVVLFQADGSVMKGVVFLRDSACSHSGRQTLADLLGEKGDFLAFRSAAGSFCLVNKTAITHLRCDQIPRSEALSPLGTSLEVLINFAGGEQLRGTLTIERPEECPRLSDFINAQSGFCALHSGEAHYLVNIAQIRDLTPC